MKNLKSYGLHFYQKGLCTATLAHLTCNNTSDLKAVVVESPKEFPNSCVFSVILHGFRFSWLLIQQ